jgi:hypothetical protein
MVSVELRTKCCCICLGEFTNNDFCVSGHYEATNCDGEYVAVLAAWHNTKECNLLADEVLKQMEGGQQGCFGYLTPQLGVTVDHCYHTLTGERF